jgi:hypothetical protein
MVGQGEVQVAEETHGEGRAVRGKDRRSLEGEQEARLLAEGDKPR